MVLVMEGRQIGTAAQGDSREEAPTAHLPSVTDVQLVARTVGHELRNAVTPAMAYGQMLRRRCETLPPDAQVMLEQLLASVETTAGKIEALCNVERVVVHVWPGRGATLDLEASANGDR